MELANDILMSLADLRLLKPRLEPPLCPFSG
jgi:hypothetical protein